MRNPYPKFVWFVGSVEDTSSDPLRLGRVRVRAIGFHPSSIKSEDLPWAPVLNGGAARISTGQMVLGFFMDGEEAQQPCVLGKITGAVTGSNFVGTLKKAGQSIKKVFDDALDTVGDAIEELFPDASPASVDKEFWTLVAICAKESFINDFQGCADVAQSIYNRAGSGKYESSTVSYIILDRTPSIQYEPTKNNPAKWNAIKDIKTAAIATNLSESYLRQVASSIKNPTLQKEAARFIQGRTDFLAQTQPAKAMSDNGSKVVRNKIGNQFGFSFGYRSNVVYSVPAFVNNYKL
jgi:hypothetical protein